MSDRGERIAFSCNGESVDVEVAPDESLLSVLRERLGVRSVKDGCAPQGQCGCCTVLVDGQPRVACVTPATRVRDRSVTTLEGIDVATRDDLIAAFVDAGASQCGFCTPGILMRSAALLAKGTPDRTAIDRALAAHLCRCTGWNTIVEALSRSGVEQAGIGGFSDAGTRDFDAATRRAEMEGGASQRVGPDVVSGSAGFADDSAPTDCLAAVPSHAPNPDSIDVDGVRFVVAESLVDARALAGKVQGRRTTAADAPPLPLPPTPSGGVALATSWTEPAYLEPDASWCEPGGEPATPLANGGAFGAKVASIAPAAARALADHTGRAVRVVLSREDCVRLGAKRPPISATARVEGSVVVIHGETIGDPAWYLGSLPYGLEVQASWRHVAVPGPPVSQALRGVGWAEQAVLVEGALHAAGVDRADLIADARASSVLLDTCVCAPSGAFAGARVGFDSETGALGAVGVRVACGDPLDEVVVRSYAMGAVHMALGWVLSESISVDADGEVHDLTIRSFGVLPARAMPQVEIEIVDEAGPPLAAASDAVFAAVAAAAWNAITDLDGERPTSFPARDSRTARSVRR